MCCPGCLKCSTQCCWILLTPAAPPTALCGPVEQLALQSCGTQWEALQWLLLSVSLLAFVVQSCTAEGGAHVFTPHNSSVNCMHFSPSQPAQLLSLSHDSLRCGDVSRAVFDEVGAVLCCAVLLPLQPRCYLWVVNGR